MEVWFYFEYICIYWKKYNVNNMVYVKNYFRYGISMLLKLFFIMNWGQLTCDYELISCWRQFSVLYCFFPSQIMVFVTIDVRNIINSFFNVLENNKLLSNTLTTHFSINFMLEKPINVGLTRSCNTGLYILMILL